VEANKYIIELEAELKQNTGRPSVGNRRIGNSNEELQSGMKKLLSANENCNQ
jgi:hypothetical protein